MLGAAPPYSLHAPRFPFRALAALAGRAPIGGEREVALAALMAVRLASGFVPANGLSSSAHVSRAAGARVWFSTLTLPSATRAPIGRFVDAAEGEDRLKVAQALAEVAKALGAMLDVASRAEMAGVIRTLTAA